MDKDRQSLDDILFGQTPLSGSVYREYAPAAEIKNYIACLWVRVTGRDEAHESIPIIPDGCVDIVVVGEQPPHIAGPATITQWAGPLSPGSIVMGVRFRPGAARSILRCPADHLLNEDAPLNDVVGRQAMSLLGDFGYCENPVSRLAVIEHWIRARLHENDAQDTGVIAMGRMLARNQNCTVDDLADHLGWNVRRLHREFTAACGYGPKTLQRIMRLQNAILLARKTLPQGSLAELAVSVGYADQAHMNRDFKSITGFTPAAYLTSLSSDAGRWLEETG